MRHRRFGVLAMALGLALAALALGQFKMPEPPPAAVQQAPVASSGYPAEVGRSFRDCGDGCPELVVIPAGSVMMGSPAGEFWRFSDEGPQHLVTIARPLAVGRSAVTFAEWDACVNNDGCAGYRPSDEGWGREQRPVINVSWNDAQGYVRWLSAKTGKGYRLLSEAEWEYACGGCGSQWDKKSTAPVGSFPANPFGLQDMLGNVWQWAVFQWTEDCDHPSYDGAPADARPWTTGDCTNRVLRGGLWYFDSRNLRAGFRGGGAPDFRDLYVGFRVARTPGG